MRKVLENHKIYLDRINLYKRFNYNIEEERKFILEKSYPLYGDVLEVGTGKGHFTIELAKEGYEFTSIDISNKEQGFARLNIKYFDLEKLVTFKIENAEHLSFNNSSFDIIFSINTMHHFTNPIKVVDELIRVVTFEGKIILSDFSKEGLKIIDQVHAMEGKRHQAGRMTLSDISSYLENKGFKIQKDKSIFQDVIIAYQPTM